VTSETSSRRRVLACHPTCKRRALRKALSALKESINARADAILSWCLPSIPEVREAKGHKSPKASTARMMKKEDLGGFMVEKGSSVRGAPSD